MPTRRMVLAAGATLLAPGARAADADGAEWDAFKARFLQPDGRILDTGNNNVSHTEGQGWGMLFAEYFGDRPAFRSIWGWTGRTLRRPHDALHSWRYDPAAPNPVADPNSATDGDLFIAMALSRAARHWNEPGLGTAAMSIVQDIVRLLIRTAGRRTVLLPGAQGFETAQDFVLNPSYFVFPAFVELAPHGHGPAWDAMARESRALIQDGRFGRWMLPPDWLQLNRGSGKLAPAPNWPPRFSYDAIRVPLYLAWSRQAVPPAFAAYWARTPVPAWVDLVSDEAAPYAAPPGMAAVAMVATGTGTDLPPDFPSVAAAPDYYSAALTLLARVAWRESRM